MSTTHESKTGAIQFQISALTALAPGGVDLAWDNVNAPGNLAEGAQRDVEFDLANQLLTIHKKGTWKITVRLDVADAIAAGDISALLQDAAALALDTTTVSVAVIGDSIQVILERVLDLDEADILAGLANVVKVTGTGAATANANNTSTLTVEKLS